MRQLKRTLVLIVFSIPVLLSAKDIDKDLLVKYGTNAYRMRAAVSSLQKAAMPSVSNVQYIEENGEVLMAVINFDEQGFIIMSADDAAKPVLAYSTENTLDLNNAAPATLYWIDYLKQQLKDVKRNKLSADASIAAEWETVTSGQIIAEATKGDVVVEPLITAKWNQNKYYNQLCPVDAKAPSSYDSHVPVGCVALAMSMVMFYYNYPSTGFGSNTYNSNYGTHSVDFSKQNYRYEYMEDVLTSYNYETAKLIYNAGVSVDMDYAPEGSGAFMPNCRSAMVDHFGFATSAVLLFRTSSNTKNWTNEMKAMLDAKQPIIYSGCSEEGCHAFLCDGYDAEGLFHFNWGWGGSGDGFFEANSVNSGVGEYGSQQSMIKNLYPRTDKYPTYCKSQTIQAVSGVLEDGSGIYDYKNNQNCTYVVAPPQASEFTFKVLAMSTEEGNDLLSFYNGHPSNGKLVKTLSGNNCEGEEVVFSADSAYIVFKTNASKTSSGWRISYKVTRDVSSCAANKMMLNPSDVITDGSGDSEYASNASCSWLIYPRVGKGIRVKFEEMDLSPEDHIDICDIATSPATLLDSYTGTTLPPEKVYELPRLKVFFYSDNQSQGQGFKMLYSAVQGASLEDMEILSEQIRLYPNPAQHQVTVTFPEQWTGTCDLNVFDMTGKLLKTENCEVDGQKSLNVADIPAGFYILKVAHAGTVVTKKLIIQK